MTPIRLATALALALLLCACLPVTTKTPLGTTAGFKADPALSGMWRGQDSDKDAPGYIGFIKNSDDTMTAILVSPGVNDNDGEWEAFALQATTLGGKHYLTARETFVKDKPADQDNGGDPGLGNIILLYRVDGKTLTLYLADEKKAAAAIKAGKLRGTVGGDESSPDVAITSDASQLDKFFASSAAAALFDKPLLAMTKVP